jgi:hypothetical protein
MRPKPPKSWKGSDGNDKHNRCGDGCQETMEATCTMKQQQWKQQAGSHNADQISVISTTLQ